MPDPTLCTIVIAATMSTFRVAVLECDTPVPTVNAARGSYGDVFHSLLENGLAGRDLELKVSKWDVVNIQKYPSYDQVDGILISGSSM